MQQIRESLSSISLRISYRNRLSFYIHTIIFIFFIDSSSSYSVPTRSCLFPNSRLGTSKRIPCRSRNSQSVYSTRHNLRMMSDKDFEEWYAQQRDQKVCITKFLLALLSFLSAGQGHLDSPRIYYHSTAMACWAMRQ
jgi:hypothetical protein